MHCIDALVAGIRGAENGTVRLQKRGSATLAAFYNTFEGPEGSTTPTGELTLDAFGRRVVFVNELVDVLVKNSSGATVCEFVAGDNASSVEVISPSFTGIDYEDGSSGPSLPVDLQTVLGRLIASFGTTNFNVLSGGVPKTMTSIVAAVLGDRIFNVKSSDYGAVGNGISVDTAAIQAALNAASAAGGGIVFFPAGTYLTDAVLSVPDKVTLLGCGPSVSIIKLNSTTARILERTAGVISPLTVMFLGFEYSVGNPNSPSIVNTQSIPVVIIGCRFGTQGQFLQYGAIQLSAGQLLAFGCDIVMHSGGAERAIELTGTAYGIIVGCKITHSTGTIGSTAVIRFAGSGGQVIGCTLDMSNAAGGAGATLIAWSALTTGGCAAGNTFRGSSGSNITDFALPANATGFMEAGNMYVNPIIRSSPVSTALAADHEGVGLQAREGRRRYISDNGAAITIDAGQYGEVELRRTSNAISTLTFTTPPGAGHMFSLVVNNDNGVVTGNLTPAGPVKGLAVFTVNANNVSIYTFRSYENVAAGGGAGAFYWSLVGPGTVNVAP